MNRRHYLGLVLSAAASATGCRSAQADPRFSTTDSPTVTAVAKDPRVIPTPSATIAPTPTITPQPTPARTATRARAAIPSSTPVSTLGKLAFVQDGDIWTKDLPDGTPRRLTDDGINDSPLWSPSGNWIAFLKKGNASASRQLWLIRSSGADARTIGAIRLGQGLQVAWSPVADQLAYLAENVLFVESADGGSHRPLVRQDSTPTRPSGINALAWSPGGDWIAYEKLEWGATPVGGPNPPSPVSQGLWRVQADGSVVHDVYLNPKPGEVQSYLAGWSPDGQHLLFWRGQGMSASFAMDGGLLLAAPVDGGSPIELGGAMLMHRDLFSWSPDGQQLSLVVGSGRSTWSNKGIFVATLKGTKHIVSDPGQSALFPAWSRDGQWIAYTAAPAVETEGGNDTLAATAQRRIWLMKPDGTEQRQLTKDHGFADERPEWSRDGGEILFARMTGDTAQLWLMNADGSNLRKVVDMLGPGPGPFGTYGYHDWATLYDWWRNSTV